jgi:hypothetical protein
LSVAALSLARHYRDAEGLSIAEIADRIGPLADDIKAYFYDPTGERAWVVRAAAAECAAGAGW